MSNNKSVSLNDRPRVALEQRQADRTQAAAAAKARLVDQNPGTLLKGGDKD